MSNFLSTEFPSIESLAITTVPPNRVKLTGTITEQEPTKLLRGSFRAIHEAALFDQMSLVELDVTALKFVNSSALRLFLDWAGWLKTAPTGSYKLCILTNRKFTWQKTSFTAITALAAACVELRPID